jgi:DNA-binding NarL/FixJ family response regulator
MTAARVHSSAIESARITVLIVDNLAHVRQGIRTMLQLADDFEVVGEAADGLEAVQLAEQIKPDIVIIDLKMPEMDGFEATRQIKDRHLAGGVIVLTLYGDQHNREQAAHVGADAFIEKDEAVDMLGKKIREVYKTIQHFN